MNEFEKLIAALEAERERLQDRASKLLADAAERENSMMTEDEQTLFDSLVSTDAANLGDIAKIDKRIENIRAMETAAAARAVPIEPSTRLDPSGRPIQVAAKKRPKGTLFAFAAHALFVSRGNHDAAAKYARSKDDHIAAFMLEQPPGMIEAAFDRMYTAAPVAPGTTTDVDFASKLVNVQQDADDFREMLRAKTIIDRLPNVRQLDFDGSGSLKIKGQSTGIVGSWVGERAPIPIERLGFDDIELTPKKLGVIVPVSNELLRRSTPSILEMIRDDLIEGSARTLDQKFITAAVATAVAPPGIFAASPGGAGDGFTTLASTDADIKASITSLAGFNVPAGGWAWLMSETGKINLQFLRDGNGNYAYKDEVLSGMLHGHAIIESNNMPAANLGLIAGPQVVKADELVPTIDLSTDATLSLRSDPGSDLSDNVLATPVESLFQTDSSAIRLLLVTDWARRHAKASYLRTNVGWA